KIYVNPLGELLRATQVVIAREDPSLLRALLGLEHIEPENVLFVRRQTDERDAATSKPRIDPQDAYAVARGIVPNRSSCLHSRHRARPSPQTSTNALRAQSTQSRLRREERPRLALGFMQPCTECLVPRPLERADSTQRESSTHEKCTRAGA